MIRWEFEAPDAGATVELGRRLGATAPEGAVLLLRGQLGAGKTTLAHGVGAGCGVGEPIASPTYNLVLRYAGDRPFTHVDLYRLEGPEALATLDPEELLPAEGITCVEWPDLVRPLVVAPRATIELTPSDGGTRRIVGTLVGSGWDATVEALREIGARFGGSGRGP